MTDKELRGGHGWQENSKDNGGESPEGTIYLPAVPLTEFVNLTIKGDYVAQGVGMRGTGNGTIDFTGQIPPESSIKAAFLYWAIIRNNTAIPNSNGTLNETNLTGSLIATAGDPCWVSDGRIDVFFADVTPIINTGVNTLTNFPTGPDFITPPLLEGASLIIIYENPNLPLRTIIINDGAVTFSNQSVNTTIQNFIAQGSSVAAKTSYIVADGQPQFADNTAKFNGMLIQAQDAFPGAEGSLWDTLTKNVSSLINTGDTTAVAEVISGPTGQDCLTWIAQVFSITNEPSFTPIRGIKIF